MLGSSHGFLSVIVLVLIILLVGCRRPGFRRGVDSGSYNYSGRSAHGLDCILTRTTTVSIQSFAMASSRQIYQPIHPDFLVKLLPEYVEFHNANTAFFPAVHQVPWDPAVRKGAPVMGGSEPLKVGNVKDVPLSKCTMRIFTPEGTAPAEGWPVFLFFHGG